MPCPLPHSSDSSYSCPSHTRTPCCTSAASLEKKTRARLVFFSFCWATAFYFSAFDLILLPHSRCREAAVRGRGRWCVTGVGHHPGHNATAVSEGLDSRRHVGEAASHRWQRRSRCFVAEAAAGSRWLHFFLHCTRNAFFYSTLCRPSPAPPSSVRKMALGLRTCYSKWLPCILIFAYFSVCYHCWQRCLLLVCFVLQELQLRGEGGGAAGAGGL